MKNLTPKQIQNVNQLNAWDSTNFHGNRRSYKGFPVDVAKEIIQKRFKKAVFGRGRGTVRKNDFELIRDIITESQKTKGSNYFKVLIEGNTGIYLASPEYGHSDYNKSRLFDKNEKTLKIMEIVNKILFK